MSACVSREGQFSAHDLDALFVCNRCTVLDVGAMGNEIATLREQVAAVEAVLAEWEYLGSGEHGPFRPGAPVTIQNAVKAKQLRAALTSPGTALAKARAEALREVAKRADAQSFSGTAMASTNLLRTEADRIEEEAGERRG